MKKTKYLITIILFLIAQISIFAQSKVAHIDTQKLISEMPEVIAAQKQLEQLEKTYSTEIENTYKEFQTKAQTYSADAANQTDVTNQARQKEEWLARKKAISRWFNPKKHQRSSSALVTT